MATTIYLDHNVVVGISGKPLWEDSESENNCLGRLQSRGIQFVMSAWHMYELARSADADNVHRYCKFVEDLKPMWANNPIAVKRAELKRFLDWPYGMVAAMAPMNPFSITIDDMWASYGETGTKGETFSSVVYQLQADPSFLKTVNDAADLTPDAILAGRRARLDGRLRSTEPIIDREYFADLLECSENDPHVGRLMENIKEVYRSCPMIAVEDVLTHVRVKDGFAPRAAHAADLQHALIALAYCRGFVTDDKSLFENSRVTLKTLQLPTQLVRRIKDISVREVTVPEMRK